MSDNQEPKPIAPPHESAANPRATQDSHASIIAEMRRWIRQEGNRATWDWRPGNGWSEAAMRAHLENAAEEWKLLLDRLEAAVKRDEAHAVEHATAHAEAVARSNCRDCIYNPQGHNYEGVNVAAMREALIMALNLGNALIGVVKAAFTDPQRNCDRFADELDAQLAFLNEVWLISVDRETMLERDKYENWSDEMKARYGRWLYALATEKEGETK